MSISDISRASVAPEMLDSITETEIHNVKEPVSLITTKSTLPPPLPFIAYITLVHRIYVPGLLTTHRSLNMLTELQ